MEMHSTLFKPDPYVKKYYWASLLVLRLLFLAYCPAVIMLWLALFAIGSMSQLIAGALLLLFVLLVGWGLLHLRHWPFLLNIGALAALFLLRGKGLLPGQPLQAEELALCVAASLLGCGVTFRVRSGIRRSEMGMLGRKYSL